MATPKREPPARRGKQPHPGKEERRPNRKPGRGGKTADDAAEEATGAKSKEPTPEQRAARQAEALRQVFPACMAVALSLHGQIGPSGYKAYLTQLLKDAGDPVDPIERMLLEQLALAHFRIAQLHADAGRAQGVEAVKIYNSIASRLLGEFRRTALAIRLYRTRLPEGKAEKLKVFKVAQ